MTSMNYDTVNKEWFQVRLLLPKKVNFFDIVLFCQGKKSINKLTMRLIHCGRNSKKITLKKIMNKEREGCCAFARIEKVRLCY